MSIQSKWNHPEVKPSATLSVWPLLLLKEILTMKYPQVLISEKVLSH
jgi:hypothetical protein